MREVQVVCPQCGQAYAILVPDEYDNTVGAYPAIKQCCPHCGYPDVIYKVEYPRQTW